MARGLCRPDYNVWKLAAKRHPDVVLTRPDEVGECLCGCGGAVVGVYLPGHGQRGRHEIRDGLTRRARCSNKLRALVFAAYGGRCTCCGEDEDAFLVLDHVDGGGRKHRETINEEHPHKATGQAFYRWCRDNDYPPIVQVLCANCNTAKERAGGCPHQRSD